ncbi:MAG: folate family ECF transporter S component [Pyramidobacter sp.]|nr:folate family ECF transporter S component [Pyramidobacter sp.]
MVQSSQTENRCRASLREFASPRSVALCGVMCALAVMLGAVATINLGPYLKIGLSGLPNHIIDYLLGPAVGAIFSGALEVLKFLLRPDGVYFPGFTLSAALAGLIYGFAFYRRPVSVPRTIAAHVLVKLLVNLGCNTLWLSILYRKAAWALFSARVMTNVLRLPGDVLITYLLLKTVERVVLPLFSRRSLR